MPQSSVFFVGQPEEVAHHAATFRERLNVQIADPGQVTSLAQPGDLAIFYSEHFDRFRHCCQQLKKKNVATLYMIDGILEWRNAWENRADEVACPYAMRPVLADKVACIGNSQARILNSWGNHAKTEVVGIPRLDENQTRKSNRSFSFNENENENENFRILVMTAKTPGFTPEQIAITKESLIDLKNWHADNQTLNQRPVEFIWRLTNRLAEEIGVENQLSDLTGIELAEVLTEVDAVITTPSTGMLEAMLVDLPVAVLDYHNCPHYCTAGWDICTREHIDSTIIQMAGRNETRMMFQRSQLADSMLLIHDNAQTATDRLVELANQMLSIAAEKIAARLPLTFPAQILKPTISLTAKFSHELAYPSAAEFAEKDLTLNQVELSHARREILNLQKEMAQLQSELDQAHQIFEAIEQHPIAGPVVRIRQKMLDLMTSIRNRKNNLDSPHPINTRTN